MSMNMFHSERVKTKVYRFHSTFATIYHINMQCYKIVNPTMLKGQVSYILSTILS